MQKAHFKMSSWDVNKIRLDFPALAQKIHGKQLIYLDNAATTQKPQSVIDALTHYYQNDNANVHRGLHTLAERATENYEKARKKVASFVNAPSPQELILTRGTTESINLVAASFGATYLKPGDEVIVSEMEHHSNIVPWFLLREKMGIKVRFIPIDDVGNLNIDALKKMLGPKTRFVSVAHMSNVLGTLNPVEEVIALAHGEGIPVLLDGAQSVPSMPVDLSALDCDFYAFSAHKMSGPTGIGALFGKKKYLEEMLPYMGGGEMIGAVSKKEATWAPLPHKFEAGTPNIAGSIGFGAAIDYLNTIGMNTVHKYEQELTQYALKKMKSIDGLTIYGHAREHGPAISFLIAGIHPFDLAQYLDQMGIAIRVGHHCAEPLMQHYKIKATARASFYFYNTFSEVDYLVDALIRAKDLF